LRLMAGHGGSGRVRATRSESGRVRAGGQGGWGRVRAGQDESGWVAAVRPLAGEGRSSAQRTGPRTQWKCRGYTAGRAVTSRRPSSVRNVGRARADLGSVRCVAHTVSDRGLLLSGIHRQLTMCCKWNRISVTVWLSLQRGTLSHIYVLQGLATRPVPPWLSLSGPDAPCPALDPL
jgi:hypothetical protein